MQDTNKIDVILIKIIAFGDREIRDQIDSLKGWSHDGAGECEYLLYLEYKEEMWKPGKLREALVPRPELGGVGSFG